MLDDAGFLEEIFKAILHGIVWVFKALFRSIVWIAYELVWGAAEWLFERTLGSLWKKLKGKKA